MMYDDADGGDDGMMHVMMMMCVMILMLLPSVQLGLVKVVLWVKIFHSTRSCHEFHSYINITLYLITHTLGMDINVHQGDHIGQFITIGRVLNSMGKKI